MLPERDVIECESGCIEPVIGADPEGVPLCKKCLADLAKDKK